MSLDAADRRRYARQLLVGEIGEAGQARLRAARFRRSETSDAGAFAVAADYLLRAGCVLEENGDEVAVPDPAVVTRFARDPSLRAPAAAVVGAFCAVEHLKQALGLGRASEFPVDVALSDD